LTNKETETIRCLIGKIVDIPPDDVEIIKTTGETPVLYLLENYKDKNLVLGYDEVPALIKIREDIKDLYLAAVEWEWEEENPI